MCSSRMIIWKSFDIWINRYLRVEGYHSFFVAVSFLVCSIYLKTILFRAIINLKLSILWQFFMLFIFDLALKEQIIFTCVACIFCFFQFSLVAFDKLYIYYKLINLNLLYKYKKFFIARKFNQWVNLHVSSQIKNNLIKIKAN